MADRQLRVTLVGDSRQLDRTLKRTESRFQAFGKSVSRTPGLGGKLDAKGLLAGAAGGAGFLAATQAAGVAVQVLKTGIKVASNLNEQTAKTRVVFGQSAGAIEDWAKTASRSFGIARDQALEAAGTFGNLLVPLGVVPGEAAKMSRSLVQLGADLASFNNASPEETLLAFKSGLVGEFEPLRRFGVALSESRVQQEALNETGKTNIKTLTSGEKVLARYNLVLRDTSLAQGDFKRTSKGLANSQRTLSAETRDLEGSLGSLATGPLTELTSGLNDAATGAIFLTDKLKALGDVKIPGTGIGGRDIFGGLKRGAKVIAVPEVFGTKEIIGGVRAATRGGRKEAPPNKQFLQQIDEILGRSSKLQAPLTPFMKEIEAIRKRFGAKSIGGRDFTFQGGSPEPGPTTGLSTRLQIKEIDARLSGASGRLKAVLAQEAAVLRSALKDSRLTPADKLGLKEALFGLTGEIESITRSVEDAADAAKQDAKAAKALAAATRKAAAEKLKAAAASLLSTARDRLQGLQSRLQANRELEDARAQLKVARQIGGPQGIKLAQRDLQDALLQRQMNLLDRARVRGEGKGTFVVTIGNVILPGVQNAKQLLAELQKLSRTGSAQSRGRTPGHLLGHL